MKWTGSGMLAELQSIPKQNVLIFDVETTGTDSDKDEILQFSAIDGNGTILYSSYLKPSHRRKWDDAQKVHGISPQMVAKAPKFEEVKAEIQSIFSKADLVVGYNVGFDLDFIRAQGITLKKGSRTFDLMREYADYRGTWDEYHGHNRWYKLGECAKHFKYKFDAHDALEDTKATLYCFNALTATDKYQNLVKNKPKETLSQVVSSETENIKDKIAQKNPINTTTVMGNLKLLLIGFGILVFGLLLLAFFPEGFLSNVATILFLVGVVAMCVAVWKLLKKLFGKKKKK